MFLNGFRKIAERAEVFRGDLRGIAAVEFALVVPVIIILLLGSVDAVFALTAKRKVSLAAHSIASLAARETNVTADEMQAIACIGRLIMTPNDIEDSRVVVAGVTVDAGGATAKVDWVSDPFRNAVNAPNVGDTLNLPSGVEGGTFLITAITELPYDPILGFSVLGLNGGQVIEMSSTSYFPSLNGNPISGPPPGAVASTALQNSCS